MKIMSKTACVTVALLCIVIFKAKGRSLVYVSDGVDDFQAKQANFLQLKGVDEPECEHMYGFLPCSSNILGHLFLIAVYQYLLFHGESYAASGSERIFKILGPGVFGASAFQLFSALPEALILLASGLLERKEIAQEYVYTAVGLLAGSSIFLLTLLWGTCIIVASQERPDNLDKNSPDGSCSRRLTFVSQMTGFGISTDSETSFTAKIMLLSVIPFFFLQLPKIFSYSGHIYSVVLFALVFSVVLLLLYFIYQAPEKLLTEDGAPNSRAIRRLFEEIDQDGDNCITRADVRELILEINLNRSNSFVEEAATDIMKEFDIDGDNTISKDEFMRVFSKWLGGRKESSNMRGQIRRSLKDLYRFYQVQNRRREQEVKKQMILAILIHVQDIARGNLLKEDGTPDEFAIRKLFEKFDRNKDEHISKVELEELILDINFGNMPMNVDEAVRKVMEEVDVSGDGLISEEEFVQGVSKWLHLSNSQLLEPTNVDEDFYNNSWKETDKLLEEETTEGAVDKSLWACTKAIMLMIIGILMLSVLAEPLIHSVQKFSKAAGVPSFTASFILVPLASNARIATTAISEASNKKFKTTSLTFSEIYSSVFMNNILGVIVLLSLIYTRGMIWEFSAELLVVLIVCGAMGFTASHCSTFPIWTSIVAYLLYPLSLLMIAVLNDVFNYI